MPNGCTVNMPLPFRHPLIILGVERSGSTWLANIIDAHPKSQLYMEPFAPRMELFPDFPDRLVYLRGLNQMLTEHIERGLNELGGAKYSLCHRRGKSRLRREFVYRALYPLQDLATRGIQKLGFAAPLRHLRFKNLNKNRIENPYLNRLPKTATPSLVVFKELRLNFKVGMIRSLWPDAQVLVVIRNPLSQIASILRLINNGKLHDLRSALCVFIQHVREGRRFEKYRRGLSALNEDRLDQQATAYWFLMYGTLLEDLDRNGVSYRIVRHERLSQAPDQERRKILDFVGLREEPQTREYVLRSSRGSNQRSSAMDTTRDSRSYYLKALHRVNEELRASFFESADSLWPSSPDSVQEYESWLRQELGQKE
ncbi:MAG: sulfotransferase [Salinivenus sp.]